MTSLDRDNTVMIADLLDKPVPKPNTAVNMTENGAPALPTTGKAVVDFFFKVTQECQPKMVLELLERAWDEDALTTLKIIAYIRSCIKGFAGQGSRDPAYTSYKWLIDNHYQTFITNLPLFVQFGYWGDLKHLRDTDAWKDVTKYWAKNIVEIKGMIDTWLMTYDTKSDIYLKSPFHNMVPLCVDAYAIAAKYNKPLKKGQVRAVTAEECKKIGQWKSLNPTPQINNIGAIKFIPPNQSGKNKPTGKSSTNNKIRADLRHAIGEITNRDNINDAIFRKEFVRPANKCLHTTEELVCSNRHAEVNYSAIPSRSNKRHAASFLRHDSVRYQKYLTDVLSGKKTINSAALAPHEIIEGAMNNNNDNLEYDALWRGVHNYLDSNGVYLDNWLPIVDVSGSMSMKTFDNVKRKILPINPALALGMLIAERNRGKFHDYFMKFAEKPAMIKIKGQTLRNRLDSINKEVGYTTNFTLVAEELVRNYKLLNVKVEETIKNLVILTDMEHNSNNCGNLQSSYFNFIEVFKTNNYPVPRIIFWNLADRNIHFPAPADQQDLALISGFSSNLLFLLLEDGQISPMKMLQKALNNPLMEELKVVD